MESEKDFPMRCSNDLPGALFSDNIIRASPSSLLFGESECIHCAS